MQGTGPQQKTGTLTLGGGRGERGLEKAVL